MFGTDSNCIYYTHTNTIVFNWSDSSYNKTYTYNEVQLFRDEAKKNKYLKDIIIDLKQ
jgi:hypothetical protein